ncbi:hypothetical protein AB9P05_07380 [Roseivirga sp. BDSF3-8]|uniref:hypothetical protein n=1 Tax=Roseivirga sp. BDSF3-8 TaxID=3241598 RepID=UPI0035318569
MYKKTVRLVILAVLSVTFCAQAQVANSPYSIRGLGSPQSANLIHNRGMGGVGLSSGRAWNLNLKNPALLPVNSLTTFEAGVSAEYKRLSNVNTTNEETSGRLDYLAVGIPIKPGKATLSLSLLPYTITNYSINATSTVRGTNEPVDLEFNGEGGVNKVSISGGYQPFSFLSFGLTGSYLFGTINEEALTELPDQQTFSNIAVNERTTVSDVTMGFGIRGIIPVGEKNSFNIGATIDSESDLKVRRLLTIERRRLTSLVVDSDTVFNNTEGSVVVPPRIGIGLSYQVGAKWTFGADLEYQDWSEYRNASGENEDMRESYRAAAGLEWTPDPSSVNRYLERVTYRLGGNFENTPFSFNGRQIEKFGINFGATFPVSRVSNLNMAFEYGRQGSTDNNLIAEEFFKLSIGVTFNDNSFSFYKNIRKFD